MTRGQQAKLKGTLGREGGHKGRPDRLGNLMGGKGLFSQNSHHPEPSWSDGKTTNRKLDPPSEKTVELTGMAPKKLQKLMGMGLLSNEVPRWG